MAMTMPLSLRNKLKTLCACGDGWSYAIFWRFHKTNPMLLTVEESYYEEQLGEEIAKLLPQVHLLGEGIVGEAAFSDKHNWLHSVSYEDDSGLYQQFSSGIKTIVVIPIKSWGVVQFGSTNKILETINFLDQTQTLLKEIDDMDMIEVSGNELLPMDFANYDLNGLLASISTENSCDWTLKYTLDENYDELREVYSSASPNGPFSSQHKTCEETSSLSDQLKGTIEAYLDPDSSMNDNLISKTSLFGEWCGENSSFDSLGQQFASEIMAQEEVVDVCTSFDSSIVHDSALASLDKGSSFQDNHSSEPVAVTDVVLPSCSIEPVDMSEEFLKLSSLDDLCQWFAPSTDDSICTTMIQLDNNLPESTEFNPTLAEHNTITTTVNSEMKETSVLIHSSENDFLDNLEFDLGCDQSSEWWGNLLTPMVSTATDTGFSECISELNYTTTLTDNRKRLFSELGGIEELLKGEANYNNPFNSSNFENELLSSNKRQMVEFSSMTTTQVNFASLVGAEAGPNLMQSVSDLEKSNSVLTKKDTLPKLQVGMLINDRNSINIKSGVSLHPKKQEEPTKPTKKKAKPGESTRPRPKDRQQIQDCIKELRGIIPHGGKCSIDSLLDRTIRYMLFLRSVIKYADMIHEPNEPKLIEQANGVVPKDSENRGATWAFEVGNQTMVCPIIVEDMNPPGQMLIEMLCEDQGFFLEIVDIIKGFGLNILKAKMEIKKSKLWARFIVEANRHVTRIDVFWSLIHLLQQPNITGSDSSNKHSNVIDANIA